MQLLILNEGLDIVGAVRQAESLRDVHFDLACDFGAGDYVGSGMEAHVPDMLFGEVERGLHYDLVVICD